MLKLFWTCGVAASSKRFEVGITNTYPRYIWAIREAVAEAWEMGQVEVDYKSISTHNGVFKGNPVDGSDERCKGSGDAGNGPVMRVKISPIDIGQIIVESNEGMGEECKEGFSRDLLKEEDSGYSAQGLRIQF